MKRIIKSTILSVILFQLPLLASELPNREGGKFGTISKQTIQLDEVSNKKTAHTKRSFESSSCRAEYAVRVRNSHYGVTGRTRIYPAQRLYGCRGTISIGVKLVYLGPKFPLFYTKTLASMTRYNTSYYRPTFNYRWYVVPPTFALISYLRPNGGTASQYVNVPGFKQGL